MHINEEFDIKFRRLANLMEHKGLEAVLLRRADNFAWLSCGGNNVVNPTCEVGVGSLLVTRDGKRALITNRIEVGRLMDEENLDTLKFSPKVFPWMEDGEAGLVRDVVGDLGKVGCDSLFAGCQDLSSEIAACRYELTESECERYFILGKRLSTVVESAMFGLRPGCTEGEVSGRISAELWKDRIDMTVSLIAFDDRIPLYRHPVTTNRELKKIALLSCNARYKGLVATITRMGHFGRIDESFHQQFVNNVIVECRMISSTKIGVEERAPLKRAIDSYAEFGCPGEELLHHQGGAMGYQSRDTIATLKSSGKVRNNQAYCWNPTITGTKSEDGFIVTEDGPLFITGPVCFPTLNLEVDGQEFIRPDIIQL